MMLAALYSGGKDSTLAVHKMQEQGKRVELLISMVPENEFSYMFHRPNIKWTSLQAAAMGIPHVSTTATRPITLPSIVHSFSQPPLFSACCALI